MSKLYFRYGAMGSGKSAALLQVVYNYKERNHKVVLIKPQIDTKGENKVISRIGISQPVDLRVAPKDSIMNLIKRFKGTKAIVIDEAQFLTPKQVDELYYISKELNITVIAYGLRCDFQMKGFPGATRLLEIADDIEELKTICKCGKKAVFEVRYVNNKPTFTGNQVAIDGSNSVTYDSVCGKCYFKIKKEVERMKV